MPSPSASDILSRSLATQPAAYPGSVSRIELLETHISWVFLAGDFAYKLKKPVDLGFVNFSTLERRRHFCDEELRLNRRLAPISISMCFPSVGQRRIRESAGGGRPSNTVCG